MDNSLLVPKVNISTKGDPPKQRAELGTQKVLLILPAQPIITYFSKCIFFYVGPPKEDIFPAHLLSPIFQSSYISYNYKFPLTI